MSRVRASGTSKLQRKEMKTIFAFAAVTALAIAGAASASPRRS
jgi:hypothetical protein